MARVAQRVSVNQVDVDRWQAVVAGDDGPQVWAEGPMLTYPWIVNMLRLAAAAAAARLEPVDVAGEQLPNAAEDAASGPEQLAGQGDTPERVRGILAPALEGISVPIEQLRADAADMPPRAES